MIASTRYSSVHVTSEHWTLAAAQVHAAAIMGLHAATDHLQTEICCSHIVQGVLYVARHLVKGSALWHISFVGEEGSILVRPAFCCRQPCSVWGLQRASW